MAPGDKIRLICEQEPTLSVERILSPEGDVLLPLIGRVNLAGKFVVEAEDEIQRLAGKKLGSDRVLILITLVASDDSPVEFFGAVTRNGTMPFKKGMTLAEIVKLAEPSRAAATEAVEITGSDGKRIIVDLNKSGGNTLLRPGDRIFFPRAEGSNEVLLLGGVAKPGSKPFVDGLTLRELIENAGGVSGHGQSERVRLERKGVEARTIDLSSADGDIKLERGDVVNVPLLAKGRFVTVNGFVEKPGMVEFREGMTLTQAIKGAGGLTLLAAGDSVTVKRLGQWKRSFSYAKMLAQEEPDLVLMPADIIDVPTGNWRKVQDPKAPKDKEKPKEKPKGHPVVPPR